MVCLGKPAELNLCFSQGSDARLVLTFNQDDAEQTPLDFTGAIAAAKFKTSTSAVVFNSFTVEIDESGQPNNEVALSLSSTLMETLEPRDYVYDLKILFPDDEYWTPIYGTLTIIANVTKGVIT